MTETVYPITSLPAGTVVRHDQDGYYFVLPDGTTRRLTLIAGDDGVSAVVTSMTKTADVTAVVTPLKPRD